MPRALAWTVTCSSAGLAGGGRPSNDLPCSSCPVCNHCLAYAQALGQTYGEDAAGDGPAPLIGDDALHHDVPSTRRVVKVLALGVLVVCALLGLLSTLVQPSAPGGSVSTGSDRPWERPATESGC